VSREALQQRDGGFYLPVTDAEITKASLAQSEERVTPPPVAEPPFVADDTRNIAPVTASEPAPMLREEPEVVVPVVEERLEVGRQKIETGGVRVTKEVHEREETVDEPVIREVVNVERVAVNRVVDGPQKIREEGTTTIIPVMEEMIVVEKRLVVKEEIRVTRSQVVTREPQTVRLRREEANVHRWNHEEAAARADAPEPSSEALSDPR
jgi:uncharacterized protein (TIGR02271 family)